jgi:hypothetical protein
LIRDIIKVDIEPHSIFSIKAEAELQSSVQMAKQAPQASFPL